MAISDLEYSVDQEIAHFFENTSATRSACDTYAKEHIGGDVVPVAVQGVCSYTVYAGTSGEFVAQFRLKSLEQRIETVNLARTIYSHFVPQVAFRGQIGEDIEGKEPLYIYVMSRIQGISYLDFILAHNKFFALSWKAPQDVDQAYRDGLHHKYEKELRLLLATLPDRFSPLIQESLNSLPAILSLPMVLTHKDFGVCNIIVNETSCNLVGVIDWAEAEVAPLGLNLHSHQQLISEIHLKSGWTRYDDYVILEEIFWSMFSEKAGGLNSETIKVIKSARIVGLLLSSGFSSRLANMPAPIPIRDDESGS